MYNLVLLAEELGHVLQCHAFSLCGLPCQWGSSLKCAPPVETNLGEQPHEQDDVDGRDADEEEVC